MLFLKYVDPKLAQIIGKICIIFIIYTKKNTYECIGFNMSYLAEGYNIGDKVDVLFQLDENTYMGNRKIQFLLKDIRMAYPKDIDKNINSIKLLNNIKPSLEQLGKIDRDEEVSIEGNKDINIFWRYFMKKHLSVLLSLALFIKSITSSVCLTGTREIGISAGTVSGSHSVV